MQASCKSNQKGERRNRFPKGIKIEVFSPIDFSQETKDLQRLTLTIECDQSVKLCKNQTCLGFSDLARLHNGPSYELSLDGLSSAKACKK